MAVETTSRISASIDTPLKNKINEIAEKEKRSFSQMLAILLQEAIDKRKNGKQ